MITLGTCSLCGGKVQIGGMKDEHPSCRQCGSFTKGRYGQIIEMQEEKIKIRKGVSINMPILAPENLKNKNSNFR